MKTADEIKFWKNYSQMEALHAEIAILSKKSPNDALNSFKLKFTNSIIDTANKLLGGEYSPFSDFETFNEDDLPSNSDVVLILGQYLSSMNRFRSDKKMYQ